MANNIVVSYRDGTVEKFMHKGRAGGSYTKTIHYEGNFAVITDEYGSKTVIPSDLIQRIEIEELSYGY